MSVDFDPYAMLGISTDASEDEVRDAYRRAARRLHPDTNRNNPGAAVQFSDITSAYNLLLNSRDRRAYDEELKQRPAESLTFAMRVTPSKRNLYPLSETQVVYMLVEITPDQRAESAQELIRAQTHLNLTLVLDKSNSMNLGRIERVQIAAHKIVDQLDSHDVLSVVAFNDHAEIVIPATTVTDKAALKAKISMLKAFGGTEIYRGLSAGIEENRKFLAPRLINHVLLLTDGNTYGDQDQCLALAKEATNEGICISAMGLGHEWNDKFLDELAATTGGASSYVKSPRTVVQFMNDHVRGLSNSFAERLTLSVAPDVGVKLESAFKLMPNPQPLSIDTGYIPLGNLQIDRMTSVLLQFELPQDMAEGYRSVARIVAAGDIMSNQQRKCQMLSDISLGITRAQSDEETPPAIMDALGRLTLYRMQERAQQAIDQGNVVEATSRLEKLATRLFQLGEGDLAEEVHQNAIKMAKTQTFTDEGRKEIKYQTRSLVSGTKRYVEAEGDS